MTCEKEIWLGTSLWGWAVAADEAHAMLDLFAARGGTTIDTASNYPINGDPRSFGVAGRIVADWLRANSGSGIEVLCKVGALDNLGGSNASLDGSAILVEAELARGRFGDALGGIAIHWDDREDPTAIERTIDVLRDLHGEGLRIGASGLRRPDIYAAAAPDLASDWWLQVKENASTARARQRLAAYLPTSRFMAYGINMGGVKKTSSSSSTDDRSSLALRKLEEPPVVERLRGLLACPEPLSPRPKSLNDLAMLLIHTRAGLSGMIAGPRDVDQLRRTLDFGDELKSAEIDLSTRTFLAEFLPE